MVVVRSVCRVERRFAAKRARARGYNIPSSPTKVAFVIYSCIKMYCESCKSTDRITQQTYPWPPNADATGVREWRWRKAFFSSRLWLKFWNYYVVYLYFVQVRYVKLVSRSSAQTLSQTCIGSAFTLVWYIYLYSVAGIDCVILVYSLDPPKSRDYYKELLRPQY